MYAIEIIAHHLTLCAPRCLARHEALLEEFEISMFFYTTIIEQHSNPTTFLFAHSIIPVQEFLIHTDRWTNLWDITIQDNEFQFAEGYRLGRKL